jgi:hypothetical protein
MLTSALRRFGWDRVLGLLLMLGVTVFGLLRARW